MKRSPRKGQPRPLNAGRKNGIPKRASKGARSGRAQAPSSARSLRMRSAPVIAFSPIGGRPPDFVTGGFVTGGFVTAAGMGGRGQPGSAACRSQDSAHLRASAQSFRCFMRRPRHPRKGAASLPAIRRSSHARRCRFAQPQYRSASCSQQGAGELPGAGGQVNAGGRPNLRCILRGQGWPFVLTHA